AEIRSLLRLALPNDSFVATAALTTPTGVTVELDLSVDARAQWPRLVKELAAALKERDVNAAKLGSEAFTGKAPTDVVANVRRRVETAEADIVRVTAALEALPPV
ncbi:MAG: valine--tRNA ligase, partial [Actinomycetota bacterium]